MPGKVHMAQGVGGDLRPATGRAPAQELVPAIVAVAVVTGEQDPPSAALFPVKMQVRRPPADGGSLFAQAAPEGGDHINIALGVDGHVLRRFVERGTVLVIALTPPTDAPLPVGLLGQEGLYWK